nr:hypothetical protein [Tanacetum cinerariifolium]
KDYKDIIKDSIQANVINEVKNFLPKFLPQVVKEALEKIPPSLDKDPSVESNQGKKTKKRRVNESESSKNACTTKESSKGKSMAKTSKSGKSVTADEPVEELVFKIASYNVEQTIDNDVSDAGQPPHTDAYETKAYVASKIPKKDWFMNDPKPKTLNLN